MVGFNRKMLEIGHVLGLANPSLNPLQKVEGMQTPKWSNAMAKQRFKDHAHQLKVNCAGLPLHYLDYAESRRNNPIRKMLMRHSMRKDLKKMGYAAIQTRWDSHSVSFHFVQEGANIHLIYVNKGGRPPERDKDPNVIRWTFPESQFNEIFGTLFDQCTSKPSFTGGKFWDITHFLNDMDKRETTQKHTLNTEPKKQSQKVGNCTIANSNMSWHLLLTGKKLKSNPDLSFLDAYEQVKADYKKLRKLDREVAFVNFIKAQDRLNQGEYFFHLVKIMTRFFDKDYENRDRNVVQSSVDALMKEDPSLILKFLKTISSDPFFQFVSSTSKSTTDDISTSNDTLENQQAHERLKRLDRSKVLYVYRSMYDFCLKLQASSGVAYDPHQLITPPEPASTDVVEKKVKVGSKETSMLLDNLHNMVQQFTSEYSDKSKKEKCHQSVDQIIATCNTLNETKALSLTDIDYIRDQLRYIIRLSNSHYDATYDPVKPISDDQMKIIHQLRADLSNRVKSLFVSIHTNCQPQNILKKIEAIKNNAGQCNDIHQLDAAFQSLVKMDKALSRGLFKRHHPQVYAAMQALRARGVEIRTNQNQNHLHLFSHATTHFERFKKACRQLRPAKPASDSNNTPLLSSQKLR